jgi:CubicO group peptidase (beta-lactamase class C family)
MVVGALPLTDAAWASQATVRKIDASNALPLATPEEVGLSAERLERIGEVLGAGVKSGEIPGYVALVARRGRIAYFESDGVVDPGRELAMPRNAIFRIYSMTKPITSTAVMILVEEGKIKLSDPVSKYLPELEGLKAATNADEAETEGDLETEAAAQPIMVVDLLRHTSGITYGVFGDSPVEKQYLDGGMNDLDITNEKLVSQLSKLPLKYQPGTVWEYGRSTDVLGRLVEVVSGQTLGEFFQAKIFKPLGMADTAFHVAANKRERLAEPLVADREGLVLKYIDVSKPPSFEAGGQGLTSTVIDYARFLQMMLNGGELEGERILGRKTVELMTQDHVGDMFDHGTFYIPGPGHGFGLGFAVRSEGPRSPGILSAMQGSAGEYFWAGYAGTYFWVDPSEELIGIYMMQSVKQLLPYATSFKSLVLQAVTD